MLSQLDAETKMMTQAVAEGVGAGVYIIVQAIRAEIERGGVDWREVMKLAVGKAVEVIESRGDEYRQNQD